MKRYMNMALLYAVLAMAGGVFYREFDGCHVCCTGSGSGTQSAAFFRHGRVHFRHGRNRTYSAGRQPGASASAGQTQRIGSTEEKGFLKVRRHRALQNKTAEYLSPL